MEKLGQCLYCLKLNIKSTPLLIINCLCQICEACLNFLIKSQFFSCPFCDTEFKKMHQDLALITVDVNSNQPEFSSSKVSNHLKNLLKSYNEKKKQFFTLISLRNSEEISVLSSILLKNPSEISTLLEFIRKMNIFHYNKIYPLIRYTVYDGCCSTELSQISSMVLKREKSKLQDSGNFLFLGNNFAYYLILDQGIVSHKFKIISGSPTCVIELGIGNSAGVDSSIFLNSLEIKEDDKVIYTDFPQVLINNTDSRLTFGIELSNPIWLYEGRTYDFSYHVCVRYCYAVRYVEEFYEVSGLKIQHFNMENVAFLTFYLKVKK